MLLGIDLGTSSVKVSLLDPQTGLCTATASAPEAELPRHAPQVGWTEQNPHDWWKATIEAIKQLPQDQVARVTAIGIGYQMHGLVLVDRDANPVRPSIIWSDGRAVESGLKIAKELGPAIVDTLLNEPGNFTLAKLRWVKENEPESLVNAKYAFLPGDYLAFKLTGRAQTTSTGLSEMMAFNHTHRKPSDEAWSAAAGDLTLRPPLTPILGDQGQVTPESSQVTGLPTTATVTYRAGDQTNNAFSLGVYEPGTLAAVAGTSGVLYGIASHPARDPQNRVNAFVHVTDQPHAPRLGVLMCINGAGSSYSWLRKISNSTFENLNLLAEQVPIGSDGVMSFPFGNGAERIFQNKILGGSLEGIDYTKHDLSHLARANLEGVAMTLRYGLDIMSEVGVTAKTVRVGDASMFRSALFCNMVASLLDATVELYDTDGSLGAARAAGLGAEIYKTEQEALASLVLKASYRATETEAYNSAYQDWLSRLSLKIS